MIEAILLLFITLVFLVAAFAGVVALFFLIERNQMRWEDERKRARGWP